MSEIEKLESDKIELIRKSDFLSKKKFNFLIRPILIFPIFTFILPFIPLRGGHDVAELIGRDNSFMLYGCFYLIAMIPLSIAKYNDNVAEIFDIQFDLDRINREINKLKN